MKNITKWSGLVVALIAGLLGSATLADAQGGTAQVILARAPVEFVSKGQTAAQPLQKGAKLSEGDRIRTGKGGAAEVVLGDGSLVRLAELSDLEIDKLDVDAANQPVTSHFNLASGGARAWVARQVVARVGSGTGMGRFAIQSPTAVAAVRQTDFAIVDDLVYTFAGVVETRSADPARPGSVQCGRNRFTDVKKLQCEIIPMREKRRLLSPTGLAVEGAFLEPNNLDNTALNFQSQILTIERMTGTWTDLGPGGLPGQPTPPEGAGAASIGTVTVTVK